MPRWTWSQEPIDGGDAIVVDIDGVIADAAHRQHHLDGPRKKWGPFFAACGDDAVLPTAGEFLDDVPATTTRVLLTARPESIHDQTRDWLVKHNIPWDLLVMRGRKDHGPSPTMKRTAVHQLRDAGFTLLLAVDDDQRNIAMFTDEGIPTAYVPSGYHEA